MTIQIAPAVSYYARTPSDTRAMREILRHWPSQTASAIYIGCAYGDDFFSWVPVDWGLPVAVGWAVLDIRDECVKFCQKHCQVEIAGMQGNFNSGTCPIQGFDFMVANRVWTNDIDYNRSGLVRLLQAKPGVLFTRGHYHDCGQFKSVAESQGYHAYRHYTMDDDVPSAAIGCVCAAPRIDMDWESSHTKLVRL